MIPRSQRAPCELIWHRVQLGACAQKDSPTASHGTGCRERGRMRRSTEYGSFAGAHGYGYPIAQLPSAELRICHVHSFNQPQSEAAECAEVPHLAATRAFKLRTSTIHAAKRAVLDSRGGCFTRLRARSIWLLYRDLSGNIQRSTVMRVPLGTNRSLHQLFWR